ncbi:MAG: hypothetical protein IT198_10650, partial [Acidimicrobiia bacterium]|nr:hypothetical protein [Acidimicrobiia bacterium]
MQGFCDWCHQEVPLNPDGTCFLGHPATAVRSVSAPPLETMPAMHAEPEVAATSLPGGYVAPDPVAAAPPMAAPPPAMGPPPMAAPPPAMGPPPMAAPPPAMGPPPT